MLSAGSLAAAFAAPVSRDDPESSDPGHKPISTAAGSAVVVTANPLASSAALRILKDGGTAADALVTAQAVLAVVEPQSSGLAGGGFLLYWDAQAKELEVLDGREVAPRSSRPGDLLTPTGDPLPWREATAQLDAIGIPGTVALLWEAHQQFGRLTWANTLQPAIGLASDGFLPSPRLLRSISLAQRIGVGHNQAFTTLYLPGGKPPPADQAFRNPQLARTLEALAQQGGPDFYRGTLARQILQEMARLKAGDPDFRGWSRSDLSSYTVLRRQPLCSQQLKHRICTMPPPSSGGVGLLQTLALLDQSTDLPGSSAADPQSWRQLAKAQAWADSDRLYWVHDPIDGGGPVAALLNPAYIKGRADKIQATPSAQPSPGLPAGIGRYPYGRPNQGREQGTTQVTIVDGFGNIASYTSSVETVFGSRHLVAGMVMNNQLTDFAFQPMINGQAVANRRLPGRRPMSSMAPTLVFKQGQPVLALGSPGGRSIPHLLSRVLLASLIWNESPQQSVGLPHLSSRGQGLVLEQDPPIPWPLPLDQLQTSDHLARLQRVGSGTALVQRINDRWHGAADPRREGTALALP
ncbi:gamma-glutamyltransferase family protein [Synechococcus sp. MIT S9508]|uniref:gamma-glutamyltransferase family protein n=1 Tax=Synechococcus sp. MIT S9508 TaxID=1801629 RepID=UPI0007BB3285|nr:gamma-glutamyltransferase family protein [Synechococcus sp. MIT S9508]KZR91223.1 Gamma-glutamyltranspeptidase precursor [Synechococcus sp. MIT S9508]